MGKVKKRRSPPKKIWIVLDDSGWPDAYVRPTRAEAMRLATNEHNVCDDESVIGPYFLAERDRR